MNDATPTLHALRAFEATARLGSFAQAARELGVTPSAVSQQVSKLESDLGIALFDRIRQRLQLTDAGNGYWLSLRSAFERIDSATIDLLRHGGIEHVTLGALPSLASYWLIPRLPPLLRMHPGMRLQLLTLSLDFTATDRAPDLQGGGIDLGLFYGDGHWPDLRAEKLMDERLIAVASPVICGDAQRPDAEWLGKLPLLRHSTRPDSWASWFQAQNQREREPQTSFEHFYMLVEAAKAGLGIALVPDVYVEGDLRNRTLVRVSSFALTAMRAYYLVFAPDRDDDPTLRRLREWLHGEARE